jgi:hypothetical protein
MVTAQIKSPFEKEGYRGIFLGYIKIPPAPLLLKEGEEARHRMQGAAWSDPTELSHPHHSDRVVSQDLGNSREEGSRR